MAASETTSIRWSSQNTVPKTTPNTKNKTTGLSKLTKQPHFPLSTYIPFTRPLPLVVYGVASLAGEALNAIVVT